MQAHLESVRKGAWSAEGAGGDTVKVGSYSMLAWGLSHCCVSPSPLPGHACTHMSLAMNMHLKQ